MHVSESREGRDLASEDHAIDALKVELKPGGRQLTGQPLDVLFVRLLRLPQLRLIRLHDHLNLLEIERCSTLVSKADVLGWWRRSNEGRSARAPRLGDAVE